MKKLLALLFFVCMSVGLMGMENDDKNYVGDENDTKNTKSTIKNDDTPSVLNLNTNNDISKPKKNSDSPGEKSDKEGNKIEDDKEENKKSDNDLFMQFDDVDDINTETSSKEGKKTFEQMNEDFNKRRTRNRIGGLTFSNAQIYEIYENAIIKGNVQYHAAQAIQQLKKEDKNYRSLRIDELIENTEIEADALKEYKKRRGWKGAAEDFSDDLKAKTRAYVIDGIAQHLARPIVEVASIPITKLQNLIFGKIFKDKIEEGILAEAQQECIQKQQEYIKKLSTTSNTFFENINKKDVLTKQLKDFIQEKGINFAELRRLEEEEKSLIAEYTEGLFLNFQERAKEGILSAEEKKISNIFTKQQQQLQRNSDHDSEEIYKLARWLEKELFLNFQSRVETDDLSQKEREMEQEFQNKRKVLAEKFKQFKEDDFKLIEIYNQTCETKKNDIYENLNLIEKQNNIIKHQLSGVEADVVAREKALMKKMHEREQALLLKEKARQARLKTDQKSKTKEEFEIQRANEKSLNAEQRKHNMSSAF